MKIATWNVNSLKIRLPQVLTWLQANPVDILCLQETKLIDDRPLPCPNHPKPTFPPRWILRRMDRL